MDYPEEDWEGKIEIDVAEDPDPPGWTQGQGSGASSDVIKTEPVTANICSDVIKTEPITANICSDVIKTEPITANICSDVIKTEPVTPNISSDVIKTEPVTADISSDVIKTEPITADISTPESITSRQRGVDTQTGEEFVPHENELQESDSSDMSEGDDDEVGAGAFDGNRPGDDEESDQESVAEEDKVMWDDDDDDDNDYMTDWCRSLNNFPLHPPFTGTAGLQGPLRLPHWEDCRPVDFYKLFITDGLIKDMKRQTNKYAAETIARKQRNGVRLSPRSFYTTWNPVTLSEMKQFLAVLIHIGIVKKPRLVDYWSRNSVLRTTFAAQLMKRDRFRSILTFFHLSDNNTYVVYGQPDHDPLHKVRPLFDHLVMLFRTVYIPERDICVDEALCPWRGRSAFRVYTKDKLHKWGMKMYELCESSSGYVWNMEVMCHAPGVSHRPYDVMQRLIRDLKNCGHVLYVDNRYCNPQLADDLAADSTGVVGPVRSNRVGMPKDLVSQPMRPGDVDYRRRNQTVVVRWKDRRDVYTISTVHPPVMREVTSRTERREKPAAVIDYLNNMVVAYIPLHRRQTVKWWKKLAFHLLTLVMIQAHILYNKLQVSLRRRPVQLEDFALSVCQELAALPVSPPPPHPAPVKDEVNRLTARHFLEPIGSRNGKQSFLACIVCRARMVQRGASREELKNKVQRTRFRCRNCVKPLCLEPCMEIYHT
ncbi:hypothetical protein ACOMHN_005613 [Nucella lapillus]